MLQRFIAATVLRPVTTAMVTIAVLLFGLVAATRLPVELLPDLSYPTITIETTDADAAPAEIEELVTRPIEERVGAVPGVIEQESISREGRSEVVLDFAWGTEIDQAMADVREKLDRVELPTTSSRPIVLRYDPSQEPIMRIALEASSSEGRLNEEELARLRYLADRTVKRELEKIPGVAAVQLHGGEEEQVLVQLDEARLAALQLTADDVVLALQRDNINRPGGAVDEGDRRYLVRTLHEARSAEELEDVIVRTQDGADLHLRDVATVRRATVDREEVSLVGHGAQSFEAVELAVYREGDANVVAVTNAVRDGVEGLPLPPGYRLTVLSEQATFIEAAIREVRNNTLAGGALAVLVLLFFLRNLRSTIVIAVAIPISLLVTFLPLQALDVSLNVMSLGGLALGVGMLVDNSIVVLESIARVRETSDGSPRETAVAGAAEVAPSVVASTLTTIAVFFPMSFVEGVAGQLVRDLSYAVSFSMLSSLAVSLTLVPVLSGGSWRGPAAGDGAPRSVIAVAIAFIAGVLARIVGFIVSLVSKALGLFARPFTAGYEALESTYPALLRIALRFRGTVLLASVAFCIVSVRLAGDAGQTLLPPLDSGEFYVQVALPQGVSLERTTAAVQALDAAVADAPEVQQRFVRIGSTTQAGSASGRTEGVHLGQINVRLHPDVDDREAVEQRLLARMREANIEPNASLRFDRPALLSFAAPIEIRVFSEDPAETASLADDLITPLRALDGLAEVTPDDNAGRPEVRIHFDRERLGRLGITVDDAAAAVQRAIAGEVATTIYSADQQLNVRVQLPRVDRSKVEDVSRIQVAVVDGVSVALSSVADVEPAVGPSEIRRIDGRRGMRIRARAAGVDLAGVAADVARVLGDTPMPEGTSVIVAGQAEEMEVSLRSLMMIAALSVFLVYVVMASSFESLLHPFIIMFTVPLAVAGATLAVVWARIPLSAIVGIGVIVLGGIVVNNAIVLVNAVNDRRGRGLDTTRALIDAGRVRVRPILMTTLTTILGLTPMALGLGEGADLRRPLAIAVIGGLGLATVLTLFVIPCAYSLLPGGVRDAWRGRATGKTQPASDE